MTYKVGDIFYLNGIKVKCIEDIYGYGMCNHCVANKMKFHDACDKLNCKKWDREDFKGVHFVKVD